MQKARMGVLLIATNRFYHLGEDTPKGSYHQRKMREVHEYMEALEDFCDPIGLGRPAYTREDLAEALALFQREKADCIFAAFLSWTEDFLWVRFLRDVGSVPVLYALRVRESIDFADTADESDFTEFLSAGGLVGTLEGSGSVGRFKPEMFETAVGTLPQLMERAKVFCAAAAMRSRLRQSVFGLLASYNEVMWSTYVDPYCSRRPGRNCGSSLWSRWFRRWKRCPRSRSNRLARHLASAIRFCPTYTRRSSKPLCGRP